VIESAVDVGEGEISLTFGAAEFPFPQGIHQERRQRDDASPA
jgi:hypothetical protein